MHARQDIFTGAALRRLMRSTAPATKLLTTLQGDWRSRSGHYRQAMPSLKRKKAALASEFLTTESREHTAPPILALVAPEFRPCIGAFAILRRCGYGRRHAVDMPPRHFSSSIPSPRAVRADVHAHVLAMLALYK